jgi:hypothetical protein
MSDVKGNPPPKLWLGDDASGSALAPRDSGTAVIVQAAIHLGFPNSLPPLIIPGQDHYLPGLLLPEAVLATLLPVFSCKLQ